MIGTTESIQPPPNDPVILGPNITGNLGASVDTTNKCTSSPFESSSGVFLDNTDPKLKPLKYLGFNATKIHPISITSGYQTVGFSAYKSVCIYGNTSTVQPKTLVLNYIVKY